MRQILRRAILALARRIKAGRLTIIEGGQVTLVGPAGPPNAIIEVRTARVWAKLARGVRGGVRAYCDGLWDSPDLAAVFEVAAVNVAAADSLRRRITFIRTPLLRIVSGFVRNTPERSRKDISSHYDLGNELFSHMLDPTMMYSCAVFENSGSSLYEASRHKLEMICDKLDLGPDDHVLEIGTGWAGFAIYAATMRGCKVTTTTISHKQYQFSTARVREAGVSHLVDLRLNDYRELHGTYDKIVSVEMIEAVGHKDFGTFFERCSDLLAPHGKMFLQAIVIDDRVYDIAKTARSFIRTFIFPNGCLPSIRVITEKLAHRTDMRIMHMEDLSPHYVETLRRWRANFDGAEVQLDALGYDSRFRRLWRLYLAYCEAGFVTHRIGLIQMVTAKPQADQGQPASVYPGGARDGWRENTPAMHYRDRQDEMT